MAFDWEGPGEGLGLPVYRDRDAARPCACGEDGEAGGVLRNLDIACSYCDGSDGRLFLDANASRQTRGSERGHQAGWIDDGFVGVVNGADGVGAEHGNQRGNKRAELIAGENGGAGPLREAGVCQCNLYGGRFSKLDREAAVGFDRADEFRVCGEAAACEFEHGRVVEFACGCEHAGCGGTGFGADGRGIQKQDAEVVTGETPGDGCADDAAAGDDDVVRSPHGYETGGDVL